MMHFPTHIVFKCFFQRRSGMGSVHDHVVLKTIFTYKLHKILKPGYFRNSAVAEGLEFVVGQSHGTGG